MKSYSSLVHSLKITFKSIQKPHFVFIHDMINDYIILTEANGLYFFND